MRKVLVVLMLGLAGAAMAHEGVKNPAVKARMQAMGHIGASTKVLGQMAKKATAFDAATARAEAAKIATEATRIEALFQAEEGDPKSEALPIIWQQFGDFTQMAEELHNVADTASGRIETLEDLQSEMRAIGKTCGTCHEVYRQK